MSIRSRVTLATVVLAALAVGIADATTFLLLRREVQRARTQASGTWPRRRSWHYGAARS